MSSSQVEAIRALISKVQSVHVFSKTWCPYCDQAKEILSSAGVTYETYELDKLPEGEKMQKALLEITG